MTPSLPPRVGADEPGPGSPLALWRSLRKGWLLALFVTLIVTLTVAFYTFTATKIYESTATLILNPQPTRPLGTKVETAVDLNAGSYLENLEYYRTEQEVFTSQRLLVTVVKRLRLNYDENFVLSKPGRNILREPATDPESAGKILHSRIKVVFIKDSRILAPSLQDADPKRAQQILATLVDMFTQQNLDSAVESSTNAAEWLDGQLANLRTELQENELSLHGYKQKNDILSVSLDDQSSMLREEMSRLNGLLTDAKAKRNALEARRKGLAEVPEDNPLQLPATELLNSSVLSQHRHDYVLAAGARDALLGAGRGSNHPELRAAEARVTVTRAALLEEVQNIKNALERDVRAASNEVAGLASLYENSRKRAQNLSLLEIEYNRLNRNKANTEKLYSLVLERSKELDLTRMMRFNNIRVLDEATVPDAPIKPRVVTTLAFGVFAGFALGALAALTRDRLDRTIRAPSDAEQLLGVPALGFLPRVVQPLGKPGSYLPRVRRPARKEQNDDMELLVHANPTSSLAEAARSVRTNIMLMSPDQQLKVLLITSPAPGEGKTTTACCIATAMAQAGQRVLLVDCDMRRPRLHRVFGRSNDLGVSMALLNPGQLDESIYETPVPNLSLLPCGPIPPNPAELLHSAAFKRLLATLKERYDRVILDSPPVAPVTDGVVLSTCADATILVVRAMRTSRDVAGHALHSLQAVGGRVLGVLLNDMDLSKHEYSNNPYYYYYGGRDGYRAAPIPGSAAES
jgi:polysaccharide biosynthesis transport protein